MIKFLQSSCDWTTASWYDAASGGNLVPAPGSDDVGDVNGYDLTVDADISGVGGFRNNSSSGGRLLFSGSTPRSVTTGSEGFCGWKSPLVQVDSGNTVVLHGTLYQGNAQTLSISAGGGCTHYGDRYSTSTSISLISNAGTLTLSGGTLYLNAPYSSVVAVTCVSGGTNYFGTVEHPMAVAGSGKGVAFSHSSGSATSYLTLSSLECFGNDSYILRMSSVGSIIWRNQVTRINSSKVAAILISYGTLDIAGLELQCYGDFVGNFGSATLVTDSNTKLIEMSATAGIAGNLAAFTAKRIKPTIPAADAVRNGLVYGYNNALTGSMAAGGNGANWEGGYSA